jgi:hypothetical protein
MLLCKAVAIYITVPSCRLNLRPDWLDRVQYHPCDARIDRSHRPMPEPVSLDIPGSIDDTLLHHCRLGLPNDRSNSYENWRSPGGLISY